MIDSTAIAGGAAKTIAEDFSKKIALAATRAGSHVFDKAKVSLEIGFSPFLKKSYERCRYYKTLLDPYSPCDLEDTYINVTLRNRNDKFELNDTEVINRFLDGKRFAITGLAGCGKSMLMRLAALRTFSSSNSVPLFFELRKINGKHGKDIVGLIFEECSAPNSTVTLKQFKMAMMSGLVALILDGFDEVEYDLRKIVSDQIKDMMVDYPNCPILISSRPDDDIFMSWSSVTVLDIEKFNQRQTVELIEKSRYDAGVKKRFLQALQDSLFRTHGDFLKSPLLTIIMLFTYEEFAEIPNKMHAFYTRAFDTLFQKHDADKDQFVRKIKTGLSREEFRLVLSCFCAISYLDEKFSFSAGQIEKYIKSGIKYAENVSPNLIVKHNNFLADLRDAVCLIQQDGTNYVFVHRSFQEYFASVFIEKIELRKLERVVDKISHRFNDNVIPMAFDMAREKLETSWALPKIEQYIAVFEPKKGRNTGRILSMFLGSVRLTALPSDPTETPSKPTSRIVNRHFDELVSENLGPLDAIFQEYSEVFDRAHIIKPMKSLTLDSFCDALSDEIHSKRKNAAKLRNFLLTDRDQVKSVRLDLNERDSWWLDALGFSECFDEIYDKLCNVKKDIEKRSEKRSSIIDELLD